MHAMHARMYGARPGEEQFRLGHPFPILVASTLPFQLHGLEGKTNISQIRIALYE